MASIAIETCFESLEASLRVCTETLGFECCESLGVVQEIPRQVEGSFLSIVCDSTSFLIGLSGPIEELRGIANTMLGIEDGDEPLPRQDIADAVGEFVNVLGGGFKNGLVQHYSSVQLGLPLFATGRVDLPSSSECVYHRFSLGEGTNVYIILARGRSAQEASRVIADSEAA